MPRYILIDSYSGYIFGDTAEMSAFSDTDQTPIDAARVLDESIGEHGRSYEFVTADPRDTSTYYAVYRADIGGSEAVTNITDGQDREMIEAVERDCKLVGYVLTTQAEG